MVPDLIKVKFNSFIVLKDAHLLKNIDTDVYLYYIYFSSNFIKTLTTIFLNRYYEQFDREFIRNCIYYLIIVATSSRLRTKLAATLMNL